MYHAIQPTSPVNSNNRLSRGGKDKEKKQKKKRQEDERIYQKLLRIQCELRHPHEEIP